MSDRWVCHVCGESYGSWFDTIFVVKVEELL